MSFFPPSVVSPPGPGNICAGKVVKTLQPYLFIFLLISYHTRLQMSHVHLIAFRLLPFHLCSLDLDAVIQVLLCICFPSVALFFIFFIILNKSHEKPKTNKFILACFNPANKFCLHSHSLKQLMPLCYCCP